jgi:hypothetical protein
MSAAFMATKKKLEQDWNKAFLVLLFHFSYQTPLFHNEL